MDELRKAAQTAVNNCLRVQRGETVLVITDEPLRKIGYLFWEAAKDLGAEAMLTEIVPRQSHGEEPPPALAKFMKEADVLIIPTSMSLSHTDARRAATQAGARCATLPGIREETMRRALNADYEKIAERSRKVAQILSDGRRAEVSTPAGTQITMSLEGRKGHADTGLVFNPGDFSNLPAGEGYIAPIEGTAEGRIVIDGAIADTGVMDETIELTVRGGFVEEIKGGKWAKYLQELVEPHGRPGRNIAELGIGTNDKARLIGNVLEDEKVLGTVHIAMGDNASMGGNVSVASHLDGILLRPTLQIDERVIMEGGKLLV